MGSRSDKLFQKRKAKNAEDLARKAAKQTELKRVLIACEGEKTEPHYLKPYVASKKMTTVEVTITGDGGSAPTSVLKQVLKCLGPVDKVGSQIA